MRSKSRHRKLVPESIVIGLSVLAVLVSIALVYMVLMAHVEGSPRSFWRALQWASESLTSTGYGADSTWSHPALVIFAIVVQFIGVGLVVALRAHGVVPVLC